MPSKRMLFVTVKSWAEMPSSETRAVVGLKWDSWDDFGFKTTFNVLIQIPGKKPIDLGAVKILRQDQDGGKTTLKARFHGLGDAYCSLGQSLAYYEMLRKLGSWHRSYLEAMRDVVYSPIIRKAFSSHSGFSNSLLRSSGAEIALEDGPQLFEGRERVSSARTDELTFSLLTSVGGNAFALNIDLRGNELQERCAVIIGYNATGKTKLLGNIGMVASRKKGDPGAERIQKHFGQFIGAAPTLSGILAISYSAFDTFEIPASSAAAASPETRTRQDAEGQRGYVYCGLRKGTRKTIELKGPEELVSDFISALDRCKTRDLKGRFLRCITVLADEPSMHEYATLSTLMERGSDRCTAFYNSLSTGHKLVLRVAAQLVAYLQHRSLVLFDEPESHLHPSLVAALMKCLRVLLDETSSFAIIATHSPVVVQETPSKNVFVLRRNEKSTLVEAAAIETFGENIGIITSEIFNLNASESDYRQTLQHLSSRSIEEIDRLFGKPLGIQARSYIRSLQRNHRENAR